LLVPQMPLCAGKILHVNVGNISAALRTGFCAFYTVKVKYGASCSFL
jgi:hypothetical protein